MREMMTGAIARRTLLGLIGGLMLCLGLSVQPVLARDLPDYKARGRDDADRHRSRAPRGRNLPHRIYLKGANPATRPVTFVFNGGPAGRASISIFPRSADDGGKRGGRQLSSLARATHAQSRQLDPLHRSGLHRSGRHRYSRTLPGPDGALRDPKPYYTVAGDLDSIAMFMRQWLTRHQRWGSPKAIAGESYGGQRVAALTGCWPSNMRSTSTARS